MSKKKSYRYLLYLLLRALQALSLTLPRSLMLSVVSALGFLVWCMLPKERAKVIRHLELAFGKESSPQKLNQIGRSVFQNLGKTAVDTLRIPKFKKRWPQDENLIQKDNTFCKFETALKAGKGLILLTAHIGNWELMTFCLTQAGYTGVIIGKKIYYEPFNQVLEDIRQGTGVKILYREESPKVILRTLKDNLLVGILPDQDVDSIEGIFVPFFGTLAYTATAPAKISLASGAPILPAFVVREGKRYRLISGELIWPQEDLKRDEAITQMTMRWSHAVETVIRNYPEQWVWMHRRWKTRPQPDLENAEKTF